MSGDIVRSVVEEGRPPVDITSEPWAVSDVKLPKFVKFVSLEAIVEPGTTVTLAYVPTRPTRVPRIIVPPGVGRHFEVIDVRVGDKSQLLKGDAIAAEHFEHPNIWIDLDDVSHEGPFALMVRNISGQTHTFSAALDVRPLDV